MSNNEIINDDSIRMAQAVANSDTSGYSAIAQDIWTKHKNDGNNDYIKGVREGANHLLRDGYADKDKTSVVGDFFRNNLPLANEGSSHFAKAQIKDDGTIEFSNTSSPVVQRGKDIIDPNAAVERAQAGNK